MSSDVAVVYCVRAGQFGPGRGVSVTGTVDSAENSGMSQHYQTQVESSPRSALHGQVTVPSLTATTRLRCLYCSDLLFVLVHLVKELKG